MPPKGPVEQGTEQKTTQDTLTPAENPQQISKDGKVRVPRSQTGRTTKQKANGPSSSNISSNRGESSIQATHQHQPFRNNLSRHNLHRDNKLGNNSIHSTVTSTQPSYLNNQWRAHSSQQTPPVDTESLTQALEQLTTQDNSQDTTTTPGPTKSRWRTARPRQSPANNTITPPTTTKTPSHNTNTKPNPRQTTQAATLQQQPQASPKKRGEHRQYLLPRPKPSASYAERASLPPRRLSSPRKLLIVLDLNGTLLLRSGRGSKYTPRPHVPEFLAYCLEHHALIVWSSARPHNVTAMVAQLFTPEQHAKLVKIWSRDHLRLGVHFNAKVQVYKQLTWLWEDPEVQASFPTSAEVPFKVEDGWKKPPQAAKWDQSNTVLLDDSLDKAASEPHNLIQVDEFTKETKLDGDDVLGHVLAYLEDLKWEADVSAAMRVRPFVNGKGEGWDWTNGERRPSA